MLIFVSLKKFGMLVGAISKFSPGTGDASI
jgi:hypothetical protein